MISQRARLKPLIHTQRTRLDSVVSWIVHCMPGSPKTGECAQFWSSTSLNPNSRGSSSSQDCLPECLRRHRCQQHHRFVLLLGFRAPGCLYHHFQFPEEEERRWSGDLYYTTRLQTPEHTITHHARLYYTILYYTIPYYTILDDTILQSYIYRERERPYKLLDPRKIPW